jgi:type I restriction enzyme S subunit
MKATQSGWPTRRLADCGEWVSGGTPSKAVASYWNGNIPWISSKSLKSFDLSDSEDRITRQAVEDGTTLVPAGTVLFVVRGMSLANELRVGVTTRPVAFNQDLRAIVPAKDIDGRYLAYYLKGSEQIVLGLVNNASHGTKRLPTELVEAIHVPIPPLSEQQRVAAILDKADAIRRKREQGMRLTEKLPRSTFLEMFGDPMTNPKGWNVVALGDLIAEGPQNGLYRPSSDYGNGTLIVRIDAFRGGETLTADSIGKRVRLDDSTRRLYQLEDGDLLINRVNSRSHLGKAAVVTDLREPVVFESNMMRVSLKRDRAHPIYLLTLFGQPAITRQIQSAAKDAVNQSSINQTDVRAFRLPLPPLPLQKRFAAIHTGTMHLRARMSQAKAEEKLLFASLVQRAFRGEL